ncbi:uncharacterized protein PADG_04354 [Paracoccidioides brasiliensis Pb18]|uniref:CENP-V/GFA domain-containing protein n=1 Tax=Paracoccidioides brasiliensis (strain Pb18) TaxID=502780 RepID=C1GAR8_PARBD|nr:uncharacterized protein PADG_04354 [Paracoccidioides brasiliensis Pb18]EEH48270.2 hypothetical protein PADG_04354 [Paracoccidioides brasiliensis Pb18]ODH52374.1 hypothetical protein GX48_01437 [Paracoccidioides brasiliensis]
MTTVKGRCHCGQTDHCDACKVINGSDYTLNQIVPKENFELTKGNLGSYTYDGDSGISPPIPTQPCINKPSDCNLLINASYTGNPVHCFFCPNCTTHIYHHQTVAGPKYVIRTASLEGAKEWQVAAEIYAMNNIKWQPTIAEADHVFQLTPPS